MKLYALGALETYQMIYGDSIKRVHLAIVQPNIGDPKEWETTVEHLREWGETVVKPTAALAWEGKGDFCPGEWCDSGFCPAKATCKARVAKLLEVEPLVGSVPEAWKDGNTKEAAQYGEALKKEMLLSDAEVGDILTRAQRIAKWVKSLEDYALSALLKGKEIPGYKAVRGRSSREWIDGPDTAFEKLKKAGVDEAVLWEKKPVSVAALEKVFGKPGFKKIADGLWNSVPGAPTLAPASDRRKAYVTAQEVFKPVETQDE